MTGTAGTMDIVDADLPVPDSARPTLLDGADYALTQPTARRHRIKPLTLEQRKAMKERFGGKSLEGVKPGAAWKAQKTPEASVRKLSWAKLPADAMAFYSH